MVSWNITESVKWSAILVGWALVVATVGIWVVSSFNPERRYTNIKLRLQSYWIVLVIFFFCLLKSKAAVLTMFGVVSFLALKEYLSMIPTRRADRRVLFWAYISIPFQYYWIAQDRYDLFLTFIPVYVFLFLPMRMILIGEEKNFLKGISTIHWGLMTMVFSLSHVAYLVILDPSKNPAGEGAGLVVYLFLLLQINDVAQALVGRLMGSRKITPEMSPKKTVEGFLGGIVFSVLFSYFAAHYLTPLDSLQALYTGLIISVCGFLGDVTMSAVKEDLGVEDFGSFWPGYGSILNRVDSLTFAAPVFFHLMKVLYYP